MKIEAKTLEHGILNIVLAGRKIFRAHRKST